MNAVLLVTCLLGVGPYWSVASDGTLIVVVPLVEVRQVEVLIEEPRSTGKLMRLPGPRHPGPHPGCGMCIGNHVLQSHGVDREYLDRIGSSQWVVLHDNLHNDSAFQGHGSKPSGHGSTYGASSSKIRWQLFGRFRR